MIRWSYGYRYLLAPETECIPNGDLESRHEEPSQIADADENTPLITHDRQSTGGHSRRTSQSGFSEYEYSTAGTSPLTPSTPLRPSTPLHPKPLGPTNDSDITSFPTPFTPRSHPWYHRTKSILKAISQEFLEFMNMPLWAMLVAVTVALFPQLQHFLFFEKNGFIRGSVIFAIQTCGDVSIPLILVILGANLANEEPVSQEEMGMEILPIVERKWKLTQRQRGIVLGVATRMVIVPVSYPPPLVYPHFRGKVGNLLMWCS